MYYSNNAYRGYDRYPQPGMNRSVFGGYAPGNQAWAASTRGRNSYGGGGAQGVADIWAAEGADTVAALVAVEDTVVAEDMVEAGDMVEGRGSWPLIADTAGKSNASSNRW